MELALRKLVSFLQNKHTLMVRSSKRDPRYLPKEAEPLCSHKNLHMNVYRFIHNFQNLKQPSCPLVGEWLSKLCYIQEMEY